MRYCATMHTINVKPQEVFQALAEPIRIRIIRLLAETGEEACLCELVDSLLEPQHKLSRHAKVLRQAGLLTSQKEGRWVYHRLAEAPDYLQQLYAMVRSLPDSYEIYSTDLRHFKERMQLREDGRCRIGIISDDLKAEAK